MSKKLFLKCFLTAFCLLGFGFFNEELNGCLKVFAQETKQEIKSPSQSFTITQFMFDAGSLGSPLCPCETHTLVKLTLTDEKIYCEFDGLPKAPRQENQKDKFFAVLIDRVKGPVDFQFLDENFKCTLTPPYFSDFLEVHVYAQNNDDPDFLLREENFLCKTKFLAANDGLFYAKNTSNVVISYYPNKEERFPGDVSKRGSIWQKATPNIYIFGDFVKINTHTVAYLEFPSGEHQDMCYEDRIFPMSTFTTKAKDVEGTEEDKKHVMPSSKDYFAIRVPADVKEFNIRFYISGINTEYNGKDRMFDYHVVKFKRE